jgi:hypothetical protein
VGVSPEAAKKRLAQCRESGTLVQVSRGWWTVPAAANGEVESVVAKMPQPIEASAPMSPALEITTTTPPPPPVPEPEPSTLASDDLAELAAERAAIMEYDGGLPPDVADRLALEAVYGRSHSDQPVSQDVAGVDHLAVEAAEDPTVRGVASRFSGTVRKISEAEDPFRNRRPTGWKLPAGTCQCGHSDWVEVPIHKGASRRMDCRHCDRFGWFSVWHGQPRLAPWAEPQAPPDTTIVPDLAPVPGGWGDGGSEGILATGFDPLGVPITAWTG